MIARFANRPIWVITDRDRDGFLSYDIEIVVDAKRDTRTTSIGRTAAATPAYLSEFVDQTRHNDVPAEAFYTYGDGSCLVWVPSVPLDEAVPLMNPNGDALQVD